MRTGVWRGVWLLAAVACSRSEPTQGSTATASAPAGAARVPSPSARAPRLLYLPDAAVAAPPAAPGARILPRPPMPAGRCPADMVDVEGRLCIDRFEATLVDAATGREISPYYPPNRRLAERNYARWLRRRLRVGNDRARRMPLPPLPAWERREDFEPRAVSRRGVVPNGYVSGDLARGACERAGKRLCREEEWRLACRGEQHRKYPYGDAWDRTKCNVFREAHPAALLHDDASIEHLDPRLNEVTSRGKPLLRPTGATPSCRSVWGHDAVYDMVGNLDEWVDDGDGVFVGGFYSRSTRSGCDARVSAHPSSYYDYSLGVRCCR